MTFSLLEKRLAGAEPLTIVVAGAAGDEIFEAVKAAEEGGLARFILVGREDVCASYCERFGVHPLETVPAADDEEAVALAVNLVLAGRAQLLMKGKVPTPTLLKAVVAEKRLFDEGALLSHILVVESPAGRMLGVTDGGMNIKPDLEQKEKILRNAVDLFHCMGIEEPKVAILAANEKVNPKMAETVDAAEMVKRSAGGACPGCLVDGPMALDLAVEPRAAELKGYGGPVRGDADILLVHDISGGNHLGKSLLYLGGFSGGGMILGARVPIILLSRSDSAREKYQSMVLALCSRAGGAE